VAVRALTRLTHPTIDPEAVPEEIVAVIERERDEGLGRLEPDGMGTIPAIAAVWNSGNTFGTNSPRSADLTEATQGR
jgi:hypothetical protein